MAIGEEEENGLSEYLESLNIDEHQRPTRDQNLDARVSQLQDLVVHATDCRSSNCRYPNCRKGKGLFHHALTCRTRASGGCGLCKKMWFLIQLHARACHESTCRVPRCRDVKVYLQQHPQQQGAAGNF